MGDDEKTPLKLDFDSKVRVEFRGATITSDAGLLACRELDDALSLTDSADEFLKESRTGKNILHQLIPLLRQSVYSRLAGYDDTNDADRLSQDPALRVVVGWKGPDRNAASTSEMGRFETELLTQKENLKGIERLNVEWISQDRLLPGRSSSIPSSIDEYLETRKCTAYRRLRLSVFPS